MDVLFLCHCVPNPPDKGEKIRAHFELQALAARHRVHLVCFARNARDVEQVHELKNLCASVFVQPLYPFHSVLAKAGLRFAAGACLNAAFYSSGAMRRYVGELVMKEPISRAVAFTAVMAPFVPAGMPFVLDMLDVDSEKWFQYAMERTPGFLYALEARRLRRLEVEQSRRAGLTLFTTHSEEMLFRSFADECETGFMENGVDLKYFDPDVVRTAPGLARRDYVLFAGSMDYYPNVEGVCRFARNEFAQLRTGMPGLEFLIVGRNPAREVRALGRLPGVVVTGGVPDVRPYYKHARAVAAPLHIARGIQNKVLEALAMGKTVLASPAICRTFGSELPEGVAPCASAEDYAAGLRGGAEKADPQRIRRSVERRFDWTSNLDVLLEAVGRAVCQR